ncbi:phenylalanine--tRNA ligase subunit beta [Aquirufa aurantiipilula]|uniref:phenylalanine--tRNA ligase subunit beta n=1 Tax=Aquirufa aurantiipilula TaxID=2696561 RepID=UPI001CAA6160|nr:phenylalanine--tRNA ligase subunit beta [Aquirufa aurantiipilula]MBZ1326008.1 phenylalanine--tRNA ligase subunit beta [Aquirufa aurantiipilula]
MKISTTWLNDFIDLTKLPQQGSPEELDVLLTNTGLEVEGIEAHDQIPGGLKGFVVGEVISCEKFQVKEKTLSATTVDVGQVELLQIVCGAANVAQGQKVIVATPGTTLFDKEGKPVFTIEKRKVYGQVSEGMICAEDEIGIGDSHDGILVLETQLANGTPATTYFNIQSDLVLEIGLTPNRADAASHWGVARDIRAVSGLDIQLPDVSKFKEGANTFPIHVQIEDEGCTRFCGISLDQVKVGPSPEWLKDRLLAIGLRPINNIVDITNFICHGLGQPMHAYDWEQIKGQQLIVKSLAAGTSFTTLDGIERKLDGEEIMICDASGPIGLAGIMGGANSSIQDSTTRVFLEVAHFRPERIRKSSQVHGLKTDASFRFERGTDIEAKLLALQYAAILIQELAGGEVASQLLDYYPNKPDLAHIEMTYERIHSIMGIELAPERIQEILVALDFELKNISSTGFTAIAPAYRVDVTREADVIEEILRIHGLDNIPLSEHLSAHFISEFPALDKEKVQQTIGHQLAAKGFQEIISNSLTKAEFHTWIEKDLSFESVEILNKLSEDLGVMRQHMVFHGLEALAHNINRRQKDLKLVEFGKTYHKKGTKYIEKRHAALYTTGLWQGETWDQAPQKTQLYHLFQVCKAVMQHLGNKPFDTEVIEGSSVFAYGLRISVQKKACLELGMIHPNLAEKFDVKQDVFMADFDWDYWVKQEKTDFVYQEIAKFPEVRRDLSLVINKEVSFQAIQRVAEQTEKNILKQVALFDVYEGKNLGEGKKSYSISFILQDDNQTLTDKVIDSTMERFIQRFEKELGAIIRK